MKEEAKPKPVAKPATIAKGKTPLPKAKKK